MIHGTKKTTVGSTALRVWDPQIRSTVSLLCTHYCCPAARSKWGRERRILAVLFNCFVFYLPLFICLLSFSFHVSLFFLSLFLSSFILSSFLHSAFPVYLYFFTQKVQYRVHKLVSLNLIFSHFHTTPHLHSLLLWDHFQSYPSTDTQTPCVVSSFQILQLNILRVSILPKCVRCLAVLFFLSIIINIQGWAIWPILSPELQLLSPSFLRSPNCSLSLWAVVEWF
jgi:hypothetical protein